MKHYKHRARPKECVSGLLIMAGLASYTLCGAANLYQIPLVLAIGTMCLILGAILSNQAEKNAPSRAGTRTRRTENHTTYRVAEMEENVNGNV